MIIVCKNRPKTIHHLVLKMINLTTKALTIITTMIIIPTRTITNKTAMANTTSTANQRTNIEMTKAMLISRSMELAKRRRNSVKMAAITTNQALKERPQETNLRSSGTRDKRQANLQLTRIIQQAGTNMGAHIIIQLMLVRVAQSNLILIKRTYPIRSMVRTNKRKRGTFLQTVILKKKNPKRSTS